MDLRRALLLFAIVLAMAAIASTIVRPPDGADDQPADEAPAGQARDAAARPAGADTPRPVTVEFPATGRPQEREIEQGQPATVLVRARVAGEVIVPSLGLTEPAEPLTPAMFEILVGEPGEHAIQIVPAGADRTPSEVGTLRVVAGS